MCIQLCSECCFKLSPVISDYKCQHQPRRTFCRSPSSYRQMLEKFLTVLRDRFLPSFLKSIVLQVKETWPYDKMLLNKLRNSGALLYPLPAYLIGFTFIYSPIYQLINYFTHLFVCSFLTTISTPQTTQRRIIW